MRFHLRVVARMVECTCPVLPRCEESSHAVKRSPSGSGARRCLAGAGGTGAGGTAPLLVARACLAAQSPLKARVQGCREARERARGLRVASCWRPLVQPRRSAGGVGGEVGTHVAPLWPEQPWPKHAKVEISSPRFHLRGRSMRRSRQPTPDTGSPSKLGGKGATPAQQMARSSMFLTIM